MAVMTITVTQADRNDIDLPIIRHVKVVSKNGKLTKALCVEALVRFIDDGEFDKDAVDPDSIKCNDSVGMINEEETSYYFNVSQIIF